MVHYTAASELKGARFGATARVGMGEGLHACMFACFVWMLIHPAVFKERDLRQIDPDFRCIPSPIYYRFQCRYRCWCRNLPLRQRDWMSVRCAFVAFPEVVVWHTRGINCVLCDQNYDSCFWAFTCELVGSKAGTHTFFFNGYASPPVFCGWETLFLGKRLFGVWSLVSPSARRPKCTHIHIQHWINGRCISHSS